MGEVITGWEEERLEFLSSEIQTAIDGDFHVNSDFDNGSPVQLGDKETNGTAETTVKKVKSAKKARAIGGFLWEHTHHLGLLKTTINSHLCYFIEDDNCDCVSLWID